jgi:hypothetical protein
MMRPAALARSAALSLRPGPNPLAFPGLVVAAAAAVALGFAVLTAPKLYALSVIGVTGSALLSSSIARAGDQGDPGRRATKTSSTRSLPWRRRAMSAPSTTPVSRIFDGVCRRWPTALRRVGPERRRCRRGPADDIDRGASVGFETESKYRLRLVGYPSVLGAQSQVDWNGKRSGIHGEPRIFQRLPSDGSRRLRDRP